MFWWPWRLFAHLDLAFLNLSYLNRPSHIPLLISVFHYYRTFSKCLYRCSFQSYGCVLSYLRHCILTLKKNLTGTISETVTQLALILSCLYYCQNIYKTAISIVIGQLSCYNGQAFSFSFDKSEALINSLEERTRKETL